MLQSLLLQDFVVDHWEELLPRLVQLLQVIIFDVDIEILVRLSGQVIEPELFALVLLVDEI